MKRKIAAMVLTLALGLSLLPTAAWAAGDGEEAPRRCTCEEVCTVEERNGECPVCGAEGALPEDCAKYVSAAEGPLAPAEEAPEAPPEPEVKPEEQPEAPEEPEPEAESEEPPEASPLRGVGQRAAVGGTVKEIEVINDLYEAMSLMAPSIKLIADIDISGIDVGWPLTIDLNGHVLNLQDYGSSGWIEVTDRSSLTIIDSDPTAEHRFNAENDKWVLDSSGTETVFGGIITGGTGKPQVVAAYDSGGGAIYVEQGSSLTMNGGSIVGCSAGYGGGVFTSGTFEMNGDSAIIGCAAGSGGGVVVEQTGAFTMNGDSVIRNCAASRSGGAVMTNSGDEDGQFTMNGGSIFDCKANRRIGGVHNSGVFRMTGGAIRHCTVPDGELTCSEVYNFETFLMSGGSIGDAAMKTGRVFNTGVWTVNGSAVIDTDITNLGTIYADGGTVSGTVTNGVPSDGCGKIIGSIGASGSTRFQGPVTSHSRGEYGSTIEKGIFTAEVTNNSACTISGGEFTGPVTNHGTITGGTFGPDSGICTVTFDAGGGTGAPAKQYLTRGDTAAKPQDPEKEDFLFDGWYSAGRLWNFRTDTVTADLTLTAGWKTWLTVAGTQVTAANREDVLGDGGSVRFVYDAAARTGTLTLTDATITADAAYPVDAREIGTLEIVLVGKNRIFADGDVCIVANDLVFRGTGSAEIVSGDYAYGVPAIDCYGKLTVHSGSICVAGKEYAVWADGPVEVHGGTLTLVAGDASGAAMDSTADPMVTLGEGMVLFTSANSDGSGAVAAAAADTAAISAAKYLQFTAAHTHCLCGTDTAYDGHDVHTPVQWRPWTAVDALPTAAGSYYLTGDVALPDGTVALPDGVAICLNGRSIHGVGSAASVLHGSGAQEITDCGAGKLQNLTLAGGTFTVYGGTMDAIEIDRTAALCMTGRAVNAGMLRVHDTAAFTMEGSAVNRGVIDLCAIADGTGILFRGHAEGGTVQVQRPREDAGIQVAGSAKITALRSDVPGEKIALIMGDNVQVDRVEGFALLYPRLSGNARLGSADSVLPIAFSGKAAGRTMGDRVQLFGDVTLCLDENGPFVLGGAAGIHGNVTVVKQSAAKSAELVMMGESAVYGTLTCTDDAISFTMGDNARIDGGLALGESIVRGRFTCTGEIKSGVFAAGGEVVNLGVISGGTFYGTVSGSGTVAESALRAVTFDTGGGSAVAEQRVLRGQRAAEPAPPTQTGHTFAGWSSAGAAYDFTRPVLEPLTLTAQWTQNRSGGGGGSSAPAYPVSIPGKAKNGSVTVQPKNASKGDTVTVTVLPDVGYVLETLTVKDSGGKELSLTDRGGGRYSFLMPGSRVDIAAAFVEDERISGFFSDVANGTYYHEAVKWAAEQGITGGVGENRFAPDRPCTRAQIVTFLWRAAGSPEPERMSGFSDVAEGSFYAKAVAWAVERGITGGTGDGRFSPNAPCTRAQAVTFLARGFGGTASGAAAFSDVPAESYFAFATAWAAENGVTGGVGNGLFAPESPCTRAQIITFLYRAYLKK